jgi:hypothetical protein
VGAIADYSIDRTEGAIPLHLSKREVYFSNHQKYFDIDNGIGNLPKHFSCQKDSFLIEKRYE